MAKTSTRTIIQRNHSSVNQTEMDKFNKINDWWDPNGKMRILHKYNKVRIDFIRKSLTRHSGTPNKKPKPQTSSSKK